MYMAEFQVEPSRTDRFSETEEGTVPRWLPGRQAQAAIESLLLALRFRNWLGDSEKNFLDLLAPPHSVTFLIRNREYLHPEGVALFPMDLIETALNGGGQAIFTHRYEPESDSSYDCYKVHTARISPLDQDEWILGTLGPDNLYGGPAQEDRFGQLVEMFRSAWRTADELEPGLAARLKGNNPVLLINRASGRVLTASDRVAEMMQSEPRALVDSEYSELSQQLAANTSDMKIQLQNLATDPIQLCLATIQSVTGGNGADSSDGLIADFFVHTMRNKLAGITAAASHLSSLAEEVDARDEIELSDIVLGEATQLDRELDRLLTLIAYHRLPKKEMSLDQSLSQAVSQVLTRENGRAEINSENAVSERLFNSPPPALSLLFESILLSHLKHRRQRSRTWVVVEEYPLYTAVHVNTEMDRPDPQLALSRHWQTCAERLTGLIDGHLSQKITARAAGFSSTLRIPHNE